MTHEVFLFCNKVDSKISAPEVSCEEETSASFGLIRAGGTLRYTITSCWWHELLGLHGFSLMLWINLQGKKKSCMLSFPLSVLKTARRLRENCKGGVEGIMASGMALCINNAEEAAVNAPFISTGLQISAQLFFLSCRFSMRGRYIRLYGFVCGCTERSLLRPQSCLPSH